MRVESGEMPNHQPQPGGRDRPRRFVAVDGELEVAAAGVAVMRPDHEPRGIGRPVPPDARLQSAQRHDLRRSHAHRQQMQRVAPGGITPISRPSGEKERAVPSPKRTAGDPSALRT